MRCCLVQVKASERRREGPPHFFDFFDPRPWLCAAGFSSEGLRGARCALFFVAREASWGGPSVAVRGGAQLGGVAASSM